MQESYPLFIGKWHNSICCLITFNGIAQVLDTTPPIYVNVTWNNQHDWTGFFYCTQSMTWLMWHFIFTINSLKFEFDIKYFCFKWWSPQRTSWEIVLELVKEISELMKYVCTKLWQRQWCFHCFSVDFTPFIFSNLLRLSHCFLYLFCVFTFYKYIETASVV